LSSVALLSMTAANAIGQPRATTQENVSVP
jgi:hypothetical protein